MSRSASGVSPRSSTSVRSVPAQERQRVSLRCICAKFWADCSSTRGLRNLLVCRDTAQIPRDLTAGNQFADMIDAAEFRSFELRHGYADIGVSIDQLLNA